MRGGLSRPDRADPTRLGAVSRSLTGSWQAGLESVTGERLVSVTRRAGGDIGDSFRVRLGSGDTHFVKHYREAPGDLAAREVAAL